MVVRLLRAVGAGVVIIVDPVRHRIGGDAGLKLGQPTISGAKVSASVIGLEQGEKIYIQKFRRRKNYEVRTGHRQKYTRIKIETIQS